MDKFFFSFFLFFPLFSHKEFQISIFVFFLFCFSAPTENRRKKSGIRGKLGGGGERKERTKEWCREEYNGWQSTLRT